MKKAFTLLELLVAVIIIGAILALLLPAMGAVREGARRAQCMNNLRQHGIAWYLYLDDYDEYFPNDTALPDRGGAAALTFGGKQGTIYDERFSASYRILNSYLGIEGETSPNLKIFHCPADQAPEQSMFDVWGSSYICNPKLLSIDHPGSDEQRPLSTVTSPRNKVFLEVCTPGHRGKGGAASSEFTMVLFLDGHVAGPFSSDNFEPFDPNTDKPVLLDPNGTEDAYD